MNKIGKNRQFRLRNGCKSPIFIGTVRRSPALQGALPQRFTKGVICLIGRARQSVRRGALMHRVSLPLAALAAFVVFGVIFGYVLALRSSQRAGGELARYFAAFFSLCAQESFSARALCETLVCYFRAPVIVFLLGFASIGVAVIPAVCALQGFLLSFSLFSFSLALGRENFPLLLALFALRLLALLPCTLALGAAGVIELPGCGEKGRASESVGDAIKTEQAAGKYAAQLAEERGCAVLAVSGCKDAPEALSGREYETLDGGARLYAVPPSVMEAVMAEWQSVYPMQIYAPQEAQDDAERAYILILPE